jgi:hypothetical protein
MRARPDPESPVPARTLNSAYLKPVHKIEARAYLIIVSHRDYRGAEFVFSEKESRLARTRATCFDF